MDSLAEERASELEALESIFVDDFRLLESDDDLQSFEIDIRSHEVSADGGGESEVVSCCLHFEYTPDYPNSAPGFTLMDTQNLSDKQLDDIRSIVDSQCQENIGMVMIFTIVSAVQEKLQDAAEHLEDYRRAEKERRRIEREEEEKRKFVGTHVTVETFREWRTRFDAEMSALKSKQQKQLEVNRKPTGKELFLANDCLDVSDLKLLDDEGGEAVEVDESLFQNLEDLDLPDE